MPAFGWQKQFWIPRPPPALTTFYRSVFSKMQTVLEMYVSRYSCENPGLAVVQSKVESLNKSSIVQRNMLREFFRYNL